MRKFIKLNFEMLAVFAVMAAAIFLSAYDVFPQSTIISRRCPGAAPSPARAFVDVEKDGDVQITNCTGRSTTITGTFVISGTTFAAANGTAAAPTFSFASDTNTGMFRSGADALGFTTGGTERGTLSSLGLFTTTGGIASTTGLFSGAVSGTTGTFSGAVAGTTGTFSGALAGTTGIFSGVINGPNGTAGAPSFGFTNSPTTGFFRSAADAIGISTAGTERWLFNASGALNPFVANTYDIGGTNTIRDIGIGRQAIFSGSTSGTTTLLASAIAGTTTMTLPAVSGTLIGWDNTSYTFNNSTLNSDFTMLLTPTTGAGVFSVGDFTSTPLNFLTMTQSTGTFTLKTSGQQTFTTNALYIDSTGGGNFLSFNGAAGVFTFGVGTVSLVNSTTINLNRTLTAGGTTGAQTINKQNGTVNFAAGASALVVTNSIATATSTISAVAQTNDATCSVKNVVRAAGSFTINMDANCTAETVVAFWVWN